MESGQRLEQIVASIEYTPTGIQGIDELLEGKGLPKGSVVFVVGGPGSGKTTLGLQFLCHGPSVNENGVYISLDESIESVVRNSATVGLNVGQLYRQGKLSLVDASPIVSVQGEIAASKFLRSAESGLTSLMQRVEAATRTNVSRLVVDSLATLILQFPNDAERRLAVKGILETIRPIKCTTFLISELSHSTIDREYQFEEYLAEGVFVMRAINKPGVALQTFTVEKMRGVDHDKRPHPYKIGSNGIEVFPTEVADY